MAKQQQKTIKSCKVFGIITASSDLTHSLHPNSKSSHDAAVAYNGNLTTNQHSGESGAPMAMGTEQQSGAPMGTE